MRRNLSLAVLDIQVAQVEERRLHLAVSAEAL